MKKQTNKEIVKFHLYNDNGLIAQMRLNDEKIHSLWQKGIVLGGFTIAYGSGLTDWHIKQWNELNKSKKVNSIELSVRINSAIEDLNNVNAILAKIEKINPRLMKLLACLRSAQQTMNTGESLKQAYKRITSFKNPILKKQDFYKCNEYYYCYDEKDLPGSIVGYSDEISTRIHHTGWYCDYFQHEKCRSGVLKMRGKNWLNDDNEKSAYFSYIELDYEFRFYPEPFETALDAALSADHIAEKIAEQMRDDDMNYQAESEIEELVNELHSTNKETLAVIKELK